MTFASIDWGMSLEPHWFSTIYGVMFMGGQGLSAFAFVIPMAALLAERQPFARIISPAQFHDLGKLMLAFVMLWAYFALSQYLIIWSANLPEEIAVVPRRAPRAAGSGCARARARPLRGAVPRAAVARLEAARARGRDRRVRADPGALRRPLLAARARRVAPEGFAIHGWIRRAAAAIGGMWMWLFVCAAEARPVLPLNDPAIPREA